MVSLGVLGLGAVLALALSGVLGGLLVAAVVGLGGLWTSVAVLGLIALGAGAGGAVQAQASHQVAVGLRPTWGPDTQAEVRLEADAADQIPLGQLPGVVVRVQGGRQAPVDEAWLRLTQVAIQGGAAGAWRDGVVLQHASPAELRLRLGAHRLQRAADEGVGRLMANGGFKISVPLLGTLRPTLSGLEVRALAPSGITLKAEVRGMPFGFSGPLSAAGALAMSADGQALGVVLGEAQIGGKPLPRLALGAMNAGLAELVRARDLGLPGSDWRFDSVEGGADGSLSLKLVGSVGPGRLGAQP